MSPLLASTNPAPDWQAIAQDYGERVLSVMEICILHDISHKRLYERINDEGWPRRRRPNKFSASRAQASTADMPNRLLRALDMKMTELENRMATNAEPASAADFERNVRTLNTLVGLFEKLKKQAETDAADTKNADGEKSALQDADELRRQLAERLKRLSFSQGIVAEGGLTGG